MTSRDTALRVRPIQALFYGAGAVVLFWAARPILAQLGLIGNAVAQWGFLALPVVAALVLTGAPVAASLGFRRVPPRVLVGSALVALGTLGLNGVVAWLQSFVLPVPLDTLQRMAVALAAETPIEWVILLFAAALTPAVCEEIVFRGILLEPFRRAGPGWLVVAVGSLMFGAMHWMPGTFFRVLPAAFSGAMIGWMVWTTRSLWTGVWMHLVNNSVLLTAAAFVPDTIPEDPSLAPNPAAVAFGLLLVVLGAKVVAGAAGAASDPAGPAPDATDWRAGPVPDQNRD